jgi:hypothetical protein
VERGFFFGQNVGFSIAGICNAQNVGLTFAGTCSDQNVVFTLAGMCSGQNVGFSIANICGAWSTFWFQHSLNMASGRWQPSHTWPVI